jgi:hypothetical protein
MASLIIGSLVKYATGSALAGQVAAWAVGAYLNKDNGQHTQGPRLQNLQTQTSTEGAPIPEVFGTARLAGNIIWSAAIRETAHVQESGGKGGPSNSHTSYTYSCSFAVGLCEGEITGIRKIWADGILIYNKGDTATGDELAVSNQLGITVYTGSEDQEPDSTIEASVGVGNTPAYRGLAYIVFTDLQLEKYGNRIPNITCEVVEDGSIVLDPWTEISTGASSGSFRSIKYLNSIFFAVGNSGTAISSVDGNSWQAILSSMGSYNIYDMAYHDGVYVMCASTKIARSTDGVSWTQVSGAPYADLYSIASNGSDLFVVVGQYFSSVISTSPDGITWTPRTSGLGSIAIISVEYGNGLWVAVANNGTLTTSSDGLSWTPRTSNFGPYSIVVVRYCGGIWVAAGGNGRVITSQDGVTWVLHTETNISNEGIYAVAFADDYWMFSCTNGKIVTTKDFITWTRNDIPNGAFSAGGLIYQTDRFIAAGSNYSTEPKMYKLVTDGKLSTNEISLSYILTSVTNKAECTTIDASSVTDLVKGYVRTNPMSARAALQPLMQAYHLSASESDYQLKFFPLDASVDTTVPSSELAASTSKGGEPLKITRSSQFELPRRIEVTYADPDSDYQQGNQFAQRIRK